MAIKTDWNAIEYADLEKFLAGRCVALEGTEAWLPGVTRKSNRVKNRDQKTKMALVASKAKVEINAEVFK